MGKISGSQNWRIKVEMARVRGRMTRGVLEIKVRKAGIAKSPEPIKGKGETKAAPDPSLNEIA